MESFDRGSFIANNKEPIETVENKKESPIDRGSFIIDKTPIEYEVKEIKKELTKDVSRMSATEFSTLSGNSAINQEELARTMRETNENYSSLADMYNYAMRQNMQDEAYDLRNQMYQTQQRLYNQQLSQQMANSPRVYQGISRPNPFVHSTIADPNNFNYRPGQAIPVEDIGSFAVNSNYENKLKKLWKKIFKR
jgi:hypothetical protein